MDDISDRGALKGKLNEIYRTKLILENYTNNALKNSEFKEANGKVLEEAKTRCVLLCKEHINKISSIVKRDLKCQNFFDPIENCTNLLSDSNFFDIKGILSQIIEVYEKNYNILVEEFRISPLDKQRFYKMKFIL